MTGDDTAPEQATPATAAAGTRPPDLTPITRRVLLTVVVVALIGMTIWLIRYFTYGRYFEETNDAQFRAETVTIAPRVSGYVAQVLVRENQDVRAGDPLVLIEARDYSAQAQQVEAQLARASAGIEDARAAVAQQQALIEQATAQLAAARARAAHDAAQVARYAPLVASGAESAERLAQLRLAAAQSAQALREQEAAVTVQQRRLPGLEAQIRQAQATTAGARAQVASAEVNLRATRLVAPISGRIGNKTVTVGQYVTAGTRLMSIVPLEQLYIIANFKETQLALMRPGQPAQIKVDALDGFSIPGRVESLAPGTGAQFSILPPQNATGNFTKIVQRVPVRIAITAGPEARRLLVPGLSVTVTVDTRGARGALDRLEQEPSDSRRAP